MGEVSELISAIERGEPRAADQLLPLVYEELRRLAACKLIEERPGLTLQPTALVHEAYLRLMDGDQPREWDSRGHFFSAAAEAMRRILVETARRKHRLKHGAGRTRVELAGVQPIAPETRDDLLSLDFALTRLESVDPAAAKLVELRHFAGLTVAEAARILEVSPRTADRLWSFARAWLLRELSETETKFGP